MKAVFVLGLLSLACVSAVLTDGLVVLLPGYVINYNTPKDKTDSSFAFVPITGVGNETNYLINLELKLDIDAAFGSLPPEELVYWNSRAPPTFQGSPILTVDQQKATLNNTANGFYWIGAKANCQNSNVDTCKDSVEAEISLWSFNGTTPNHWPPYQLVNQRRTAKFQIPYPRFLYFWLTVTNDNLDANGIFNLYLGVQFWDEGDSSAVQMSYYHPSDPWPTPTTNVTTTAEDYFPLSATQKNDWIQSSPWPIKVGMWKIAAQSTVNHDAKFTVKAGFNSPPVQAANLNASFNRIGLFTLITLCIMKHLFL